MIALGDSHVDIYKPFVENLCLVGGASAYGLHNKESITHALNIFNAYLSGQSPDFVITILGEVDCNSIAWSLRNEHSWKEVVDTAIDRYVFFLKNIKSKVIVSSVPLPAVEYFNKPPFLSGGSVRQSVEWSKPERTEIVKYFNQVLSHFCSDNKLYFLDFTKETMNQAGLLDMYYAIGYNNVHLDRQRMKTIIAPKLSEAKSFYA